MRFLEPMTPSEGPNRQFLDYSAIKRLETPPSCAGATGALRGTGCALHPLRVAALPPCV
jgi:hypothetical protein